MVRKKSPRIRPSAEHNPEQVTQGDQARNAKRSQPSSGGSTARSQDGKEAPWERMGFDWSPESVAGRELKKKKHEKKWRDSLGWPWSGGGALGWPSSWGGSLGQSGAGGRVSIGLGYHPDLADFRDHALFDPDEFPGSVMKALKEIQKRNEKRAEENGESLTETESTDLSTRFPSALLREVTKLPELHDLRWTGSFSPVEDQGEIGSCTAQAIIGMVEYLMTEGGARPEDMSRMFLYRVTRNLLGWTGDTGAYIRSTIKALALFGAPPEHAWPYEYELLEEEPEAYHYSFAQNFRALAYARLDRSNDNHTTIDMIKRALFDGFPVAFGFPVYSSIDRLRDNQDIVPFPTRSDKLLGGHAVLAVGYDDHKQSDDSREKRDSADGKGAFIFRNSWGATWGEAGYGYLPYKYVEEGLADDFWTVFNSDWVDLGEFE